LYSLSIYFVDYLYRSSEQLAGLKADVTSLKQQLGPLGQEDAQLLRECSDGRRELVVLRAELRDIEAKTAAAESSLKGTLVRARQFKLSSLPYLIPIPILCCHILCHSSCYGIFLVYRLNISDCIDYCGCHNKTANFEMFHQ
jgi:hypothetical protein